MMQIKKTQLGVTPARQAPDILFPGLDSATGRISTPRLEASVDFTPGFSFRR